MNVLGSSFYGSNQYHYRLKCAETVDTDLQGINVRQGCTARPIHFSYMTDSAT